MTIDPQLAIIITAVTASVGTLVTSIVAAIISLRNNKRLVETNLALKGAGDAVTEYRMEVNHRMDELLALTKTSAHAEGVIEGKDRLATRSATETLTLPAPGPATEPLTMEQLNPVVPKKPENS